MSIVIPIEEMSIPFRNILDTVISNSRYKEMFGWCENTDGGNFARGGTYFWFEKEEDAVMFALRWAR